MRCIEIYRAGRISKYSLWLTLTWDVLKYSSSTRLERFSSRLTLTWDVLKLVKLSDADCDRLD